MTREEVKNIFPEATDDQVNSVLDKNSRDIGKAKGDSNKYKIEIEELKKELEENKNTIENLKSANGDIEKIKEELEKYKKAEADRIQSEKDAEEDRILNEAITSAIGEKEFVNDMTKNGYIAEIKKALKDPANKGRGVSELFEMMTKDVDGIFKNPQQEKISIPSTKNTGFSDEKRIDNFISAARTAAGLKAKE